MNRREFIWAMGAAAGLLTGCLCPPCPRHAPPRLAYDLAPIREYIVGKTDADGNAVASGAGLAKTFRALAAMGYEGVELDDNYLNDAKTLKTMLADSGLAVCGRRVVRNMLTPERIAETCEFEINYGNNVLICEDDDVIADAEFCTAASKDAAKFGCQLVLRTAAVDDASPIVRVHPGDADWQNLMARAGERGARWFVVTSEPCADLSAALASREFLRTNGY